VRASLKVGRGLTSTIDSILAARSEKSKGQYHQSVAPRLTYVKEVAGANAGSHKKRGYIRGGTGLNLRKKLESEGNPQNIPNPQNGGSPQNGGGIRNKKRKEREEDADAPLVLDSVSHIVALY
jgi:hypothetical protein